MAIVQLHPLFTAIRGRVGDVVYKTYRDKVVVTRVPRMEGLVATLGQRTNVIA